MNTTHENILRCEARINSTGSEQEVAPVHSVVLPDVDGAYARKCSSSSPTVYVCQGKVSKDSQAQGNFTALTDLVTQEL